jgi:plasmid stabilization system protein ParE
VLVLTKEQAKAVAETITIPRAAERFTQTERREQRSLMSHPLLGRVPVSERPNLLWEARRHAMRRWSVIATLAIAIGVASFPFVAKAIGTTFPSVGNNPGLFAIGLLAFIFMHRLEVNRFLKNEVPKRFPSRGLTDVTSDA